jgi:hypothetical protein
MRIGRAFLIYEWWLWVSTPQDVVCQNDRRSAPTRRYTLREHLFASNHSGGRHRNKMDITPEQRRRLDELIKDGEEQLSKFPRWLTTGSQRDYDERVVGERRAAEIRDNSRLGGLPA